MIIRFFIAILVSGAICFSTKAQIVTLTPASPTDQEQVTITFDADEGNGSLASAEKVYMHSGVITSSPDGTDWQFVVGNWGADDGIGLMSKVEGDNKKWEITLSPSLRAYYNVPESDNLFRLAMVFRNADGSIKGAGTPGNFEGGQVAENGDIFIDLDVGDFVEIDAPQQDQLFVLPGESIGINASSSSEASEMEIFIDEGSGFVSQTIETNTSNISFDYFPSASGTFEVKIVAVINGNPIEKIQEYQVYIRNENSSISLPDGLVEGINYSSDPSKVNLVLLAPEKEFCYVVGDFTNWEIDEDFQMNQTPDGDIFWLEIDGLTAGKEYIFQYWVEGSIKVGDPYADKVADPYNDAFIPDSVYPDLIQFDKEEHGIATVLQTDQVAYNWSVTEEDWERPKKENLIIYELLVRDFLESHDYKDLIDTLSYLKTLGVNAIELMPIMEFEGNESWGYNPSYLFAPDKYYGTKNDLKEFIEVAHREGFAVILDMVLNHAFGQNAMVRMYWDEQNNKPAADNPWFNVDPTHPFNVGFDFNHESDFTKSFIDSVNHYWLSEYHFDGFRFDLSKGFTQTNNPDDVGAWSAYDQSRIDLLSRMADRLWEVDENAYVILEHFADFQEESALVAKGMMIWRNKNFDYRKVVAGSSDNNFDGANSQDWITYMESHDEERLMYEAKENGQQLGVYDTKELTIGLNRVKAAAAFFYLVPGPKMMWQFQELGYDIDINFNGRTGNKPLPWGPNNLGYYEAEDRKKLYLAHAAIIGLRNSYQNVFNEGSFAWVNTGQFRKINISHNDLEITVIGNFGLAAGEIDPSFTSTGTWYSYFTSEEFDVANVNTPISLQPGEFYIFTNQSIPSPQANLVDQFRPVVITDPIQFSQRDEIKLIFDATVANPKDTEGLIGANKVYMHAGVILDSPEGETWSNTVGNLIDDGVGEMTKVEGEEDKWEITFTPQNYFNIGSGDQVFRLAMYFRNADNSNVGTANDGGDIFLNLLPDQDAPVVITDPLEFNATTPVKIIFNASVADPAGTPGLINAEKVYMHSGVITDSEIGTSWEYVIGNWGQDDGIGEMTKVTGETNKWEITIVPRDYYAVPLTTSIFRLGMVFRNQDGSREGKGSNASDIFIDVAQGIATGTNDVTATDFTIYPNPASNQLKLSIKKPSGGMVFITNALGQVVEQYPLSKNKVNYEMDISNLVPGIYWMKMDVGNENVVKKILVNK